MNHSQKGFVIPLIIAIVAVLAIGGTVYLTDHKKVEAPVVVVPNEPTQTVTTTVATSTTKVSTNDESIYWRTYTNTQDGYSLSYPSDFVDVSTLTQAQISEQVNLLTSYMGICLWGTSEPLPPTGTVYCYVGKQWENGFSGSSAKIIKDSSESIKDCQNLKPYGPYGSSGDTLVVKPEIINNITFYHSEFKEAGMGHFTSTDSYKTYHGGSCYTLNLEKGNDRYSVIDKDTNDEKVGPGPSVKFMSAMDLKLKSILSTFKFIN